MTLKMYLMCADSSQDPTFCFVDLLKKISLILRINIFFAAKYNLCAENKLFKSTRVLICFFFFIFK